MTNYAIVLTHNRPVMLRDTVTAISPQVDRVIVVDNASTPPVPDDCWPPNVEVVHDPTQPPNIARLWNTQLDRIAAETDDADGYDVALLCDDVVVPLDWFERVTEAMHKLSCVAGSAHSYEPQTVATVKTAPDGDIYGRMCGWAFILCGDYGLRADERMRWWWVDTDLDWAARAAGGMVTVPGPIAVNSQPNHWTNAKPELGEQAGRDRAMFAEKWGSNPW